MKKIATIICLMSMALTAQAINLECKTVEQLEGMPQGFMESKIQINKYSSKIDLDIAELDVYGSCGKENIGQFETSHTLGLNRALTVDKSYVAGPNGEANEVLDLEVIAETATTKEIKLTWTGSCIEGDILKDIVLSCKVK